MSQCRLLYRRDAAGPVTYLVECEGRTRVYAHGQLGAIVSDDRVGEIIGGRGDRWIEVSGEVEITTPIYGLDRDLPAPPLPPTQDLIASA